MSVEYSAPLYMSHYTIMVPLESRQNIWSFLHPFAYEVWIMLLITIPLLILAMIICNFYVNLDWETLLSFVLRVAMVDGRYPFKIIDAKGSKTQKFLGVLWLAGCIVLIQSYDGNLTAMLTRPTLEMTIKTPEDLVNQTDIRWTIWDDGNEITEYLKASPSGSPMRRLFDQGKDDTTDNDTWHSACFTDKQWESRTHAAICDSKSVEMIQSWDFSEDGVCNYYTIGDTFFTTPAVMAFQVGKIMNSYEYVFMVNVYGTLWVFDQSSNFSEGEPILGRSKPIIRSCKSDGSNKGVVRANCTQQDKMQHLELHL